ncbi:hypothetical protein CSKR_100152 [Clonorchis sinensis]|uniref:Uncharacterized protein n=1 Tax=Clonorchis sinensis TaxID=79923 RepID=A0A8T1M0B4_CLOSI|nr:hypothetical protein CSKR_100152 [Clonorchis sinensis]
MAIRFMVIAIGLLESVLTRSIPPYELCMEACGEDPHEDNKFVVTVVDMCRDQCNKDEKNRCIEENKQSEVKIRKCWAEALTRCIVRCGDDADCLKICREFHTPPALNSSHTIL